jgi:hypothetical protein
MKKNIILAALSAVLMLAASCQKTAVNNVKGNGFLSFSEFSLGLDEEVITKASAAGNNYTIIVRDVDGNDIIKKSYGEVKNNGNMISVPAGDYTLIARSTEDVEVAAFEQPVYGVSQKFSIEAGMTTTIGELTCTLLQCKVTVEYSDDFLATVTGDCSTEVEITSGMPLVYSLSAEKKYEKRAGYFAVNGSTMTVTFKGHINGESGVTMTKQFTGIAPKQWRQIKFIPYVNLEGNATFDIVIDNLISDEIINDDLLASEDIIDVDPNAPADDGGIRFRPAEGCDPTITYTEKDVVLDPDGKQINCTGVINIPIVPFVQGDPLMSIIFDAVIPDGLAELTVDITSDNPTFTGAVAQANAGHIDLVNPECDEFKFTLVPFERGPEILGKKSIKFNLSNAHAAIATFPGTHSFVMNITDANGKTKRTELTMVVE